MDIDALRRDLNGIRIEDNPAIVRQKSRDFFWYSPILKEELDHVTADIVVTPKTEADVIRILKACYAHDVPVTTRGSGTGNYGQAMPLSGGLVLNFAEMNAVREIRWGSVTVEAGAILADIDRATRAHSRQELRMSPSTYNLATVGGFVAGGSGGVGSIRWGGLRDLGNVMRMRIVTMEAEPRVMELSGEDLMKVMHAYGTNGVITELEMPLTAAYDWIDVIVGFDDFVKAARFGAALAEQDGILSKLITPIAAPIPYDYFKRHQRFFRRDQSIVLTMIAPHALEAFLAFVRRHGGEVLFRADTEADLKGLPPAYELAWNHTTLRAIRIDPTITYLQVRYLGPDYIGRVEKMAK
ncbi:MAG: FAD-binding oxidoreductase, partial [Pararhizobium sp.]